MIPVIPLAPKRRGRAWSSRAVVPSELLLAHPDLLFLGKHFSKLFIRHAVSRSGSGGCKEVVCRGLASSRITILLDHVRVELFFLLTRIVMRCSVSIIYVVGVSNACESRLRRDLGVLARMMLTG
jgi:hypothetical protein